MLFDEKQMMLIHITHIIYAVCEPIYNKIADHLVGCVVLVKVLVLCVVPLFSLFHHESIKNIICGIRVEFVCLFVGCWAFFHQMLKKNPQNSCSDAFARRKKNNNDYSDSLWSKSTTRYFYAFSTLNDSIIRPIYAN